MLTKETIRKFLNDAEYKILTNYCDDNNICSFNRKEIINFLKSTKLRNTVNDKFLNNSDLEDCNNSNSSKTSHIRPRLAVSHTILKKNPLSEENDILLRFVDEENFKEFKILFESFFKIKIIKKIKNFFEYFQNKIEKIKLKHLNKLDINNKQLFFEIQLDTPRLTRKSYCDVKFLNCFRKKKKIVESLINFEKFKEDFEEFVEKISDTSKLNIIKFFPVDYNIFVYEAYISKLQLLYNSNLEDRLKEIVDKYFLYFNIDEIIQKQIGEIEKQNRRLKSIEDNKESLLCIICFERDRNIIFYPCKHYLCCELCKLTECPNCNVEIEDKKIILN